VSEGMPGIREPWISGEVSTPAGLIPLIDTKLRGPDHLGAAKVRLGIGRMDYKIKPGLYGVGHPDDASPVLVSANYKLTFDSLRSKLAGLDAWLLILDTDGINVWCAAAKGIFCADELVGRVESSRLSEVVSHKTLILPQLAAAGVCAHDAAKKSGFAVRYGPVRAEDIQSYLSAGLVATEEMRTVKFGLMDRAKLIPIEIAPAIKKALPAFGAAFLVNLAAKRPFGAKDLSIFAANAACGLVLTPLLLPYIPARALSAKGWSLGAAATAALLALYGWNKKESLLLSAGYLLAAPAYSAFLALNFTGSTTYTSSSGVDKELKIALPAIIGAGLLGGAALLYKALKG